MQPKEYLKNKARKFVKQTWAGPGKFGVFIIFCIIIIATFESLGLSNRERNLEMRSVPSIVIPVQEKLNIEFVPTIKESNRDSLQEMLKKSSVIDFQKKLVERENILLEGAVEQFLFEHFENVHESTQEDKTKYFMSFIINKSEKIFRETTQDEDSYNFDI